MKIERRSLLAGAADAHGTVIVIDVLRAFSCSALMFHYGIRDLALVRTPQEALAFRDRDPDYVVAGEVKGVKVEGFDIGNSPADIVAKGEPFFRGRRVAARSSAGTQGVLTAAAHAEQVILGSYMTASATAAYIRDHAHVDALVRGHETMVTIVAMGFEGVRPSVEDERCGDYLEYLLRRGGGSEDPPLPCKTYDQLQAIWECINDPEIAASLRGEHHYRPKEDIVLALQRDLFDFAMIGRLEDGHIRVTPHRVRGTGGATADSRE
jgi:2-phosphosulfolactate phosphatase